MKNVWIIPSVPKKNKKMRVACQNGIYDESVMRDEVDKIQVFDTFTLYNLAFTLIVLVPL